MITAWYNRQPLLSLHLIIAIIKTEHVSLVILIIWNPSDDFLCIMICLAVHVCAMYLHNCIRCTRTCTCISFVKKFVAGCKVNRVPSVVKLSGLFLIILKFYLFITECSSLKLFKFINHCQNSHDVGKKSNEIV